MFIVNFVDYNAYIFSLSVVETVGSFEVLACASPGGSVFVDQ